MRTTVTLDSKKLDALMRLTKAGTKAEAVSRAIEEYLKLEASREIKSLRGKLKFDLTADQIRHSGR